MIWKTCLRDLPRRARTHQEGTKLGVDDCVVRGVGSAGASPYPRLFEIVDDAAFADFFEDLLDEFDVLGVDLVVVLGLLGGEDEVKGDLVGLVDDGAMAFDHAADVKFFHAGDGLEVLLGAGDEFVGGHGVSGIGPEDDNVRKHGREIR